MSNKKKYFSKINICINASRVTLLLTLLFAWEQSVNLGLLDAFFFSKPSDIGKDLVRLFITAKIVPHYFTTLKEMMLGLCFGSVSGILTGLILGRFEIAARILDPLIVAIYAIPKITIAPLFILWFGLGITAKIVFAWMVVFFLLFFNTYAGMKNVDHDIVDAVKAMGADKWQLLWKVYLPACQPWMFVGLRSSLGASLVAVIVGEFVASDTGLGFLIMEGLNLFMTKRVLAIVLVMSLTVVVLDRLLSQLEKRVLKWRPQAKNHHYI